MHSSDVGEIGLCNWNGALSQALNRGYEFFYGSGCRTACGFLNLKPYSTAFCNMTVMHDESAVGLVEPK